MRRSYRILVWKRGEGVGGGGGEGGRQRGRRKEGRNESIYIFIFSFFLIKDNVWTSSDQFILLKYKHTVVEETFLLLCRGRRRHRGVTVHHVAAESLENYPKAESLRQRSFLWNPTVTDHWNTTCDLRGEGRPVQVRSALQVWALKLNSTTVHTLTPVPQIRNRHLWPLTGFRNIKCELDLFRFLTLFLQTVERGETRTQRHVYIFGCLFEVRGK